MILGRANRRIRLCWGGLTMCCRLRHPTSGPWLPSSVNRVSQPTTAGARLVTERQKGGDEPSSLELLHHIRPDLPRLVGGKVPCGNPSLHAGELTRVPQSWERRV